jgi:bacillithiol biosynthesis deacetylase BshB1
MQGGKEGDVSHGGIDPFPRSTAAETGRPGQVDVLVIAAHPDDAEISVGGTILRLVDAGRRVGVLDLTRGEMGTRGSPAEREAETRRASQLMGLASRHNLDLPDGRLQPTLEARESLARILREQRPETVIAHHVDDLHPDHAAAGRLALEAWYLSGLVRLAELDGGPPARRPRRFLRFMSHVAFEPTLVVDIGPVWERKIELVRCYASQLEPANPADRGEHFLFGADILGRMETKARTWGERIGVRHGEPLLSLGPLACADPASWL